LVEAAVCGTPIVGFTAGDSPSILADYSLGYIVASKQSFCAQLQQLIDQPMASEVRGTAAKKALHHFDFKQTYQAYHDFIFP
jgi:glycosyltransferase involved in cell wall biosynthesis